MITHIVSGEWGHRHVCSSTAAELLLLMTSQAGLQLPSLLTNSLLKSRAADWKNRSSIFDLRGWFSDEEDHWTNDNGRGDTMMEVDLRPPVTWTRCSSVWTSACERCWRGPNVSDSVWLCFWGTSLDVIPCRNSVITQGWNHSVESSDKSQSTASIRHHYLPRSLEGQRRSLEMISGYESGSAHMWTCLGRICSVCFHPLLSRDLHPAGSVFILIPSVRHVQPLPVPF